ncbi:hypothetical protein DICVIV_09801 [Dictyocaulus viviparus]|uniref:DUF3456 domain-containing protein n=1 Tax=Dictyocaulus viviparus TaxID=29172 RepID=A0A0D8XHR4_DICVI|nr:hypothetical protein DICVIV_09801 [Dictyocaulus viviparus]
MHFVFLSFLLFSCFLLLRTASNNIDYPSKCESCAIFARDLNLLANRITTRSETSFIELMEKFCISMLNYKVHKNRSGLSRFSAKETETMEALKSLRSSGVKVDLGMPYEMWNAPAAEATVLKQDCELILALNEDLLEDWFLSGSKDPLEVLLCKERFLRSGEDNCLINEHLNHEL